MKVPLKPKHTIQVSWDTASEIIALAHWLPMAMASKRTQSEVRALLIIGDRLIEQRMLLLSKQRKASLKKKTRYEASTKIKNTR